QYFYGSCRLLGSHPYCGGRFQRPYLSCQYATHIILNGCSEGFRPVCSVTRTLKFNLAGSTSWGDIRSPILSRGCSNQTLSYNGSITDTFLVVGNEPVSLLLLLDSPCCTVHALEYRHAYHALWNTHFYYPRS
ncbi:hypothetical protein WG66_009027, partial [Moniliophthora roreri]